MMNEEKVLMEKINKPLISRAATLTKQTAVITVESLLKALVSQALNGTLVWKKSFLYSMNDAINKIDQQISEQLAEIMHCSRFRKLEASWRGLHYLLMKSEVGASLKIKLLNVTYSDLEKDLNKAIEFDQSQLFKKIYEDEYGMPGGEPYSVLLGDYEFDYRPAMVGTLKTISHIAAAAFCPFISSATPRMLGLEQWNELSRPRDLEKTFDNFDFIHWNQFREHEDSRFVALAIPRVLARLPYGKQGLTIDAFTYEENGKKGNKQLLHQHYCWMNAAYAVVQRLADAFSTTAWPTAIRGAEGGGKIENLPLHIFRTQAGDIDMQCPCEVSITDRREAELSRLGFLPICHYKHTNYAVIFGGQTVQKAKKYDCPTANANAKISTGLPYVLATSRFAHYLKIMARDKIASFMSADDCEAWLNRWISRYVNANAGANQSLKASYPLAEAKVEVHAVPACPGVYRAVAYLRPWLQFEELTTSMRLVTRIPNLKVH